MKSGHLSVRFIIGDREPYCDDFSDSEQSEGTSDFDEEWESCVSSVEKNECFYDVIGLGNFQDASYFSFPTRSLSSVSETNLSGLAMGCRHPSKSDQVPDHNEKAYLTQNSQVPELNETYLVEGKRMLQNEGSYQGDNHLKVLSNMMEEETHDVDNMSDHEGICQVLFYEIQDQSKVCKRAEEAISGLSQSNQLWLGRSNGIPGKPLPATISNRLNQKSRESITKFS